jgi:hypothetical protein
LIGDLKTRHSVERSLQRSYDGMTFETLTVAWRRHIREWQ